MNAITRTMDTPRIQILNLVQLNRPNLAILVMVFLVLISAFSIVYAKDLERRLFIQFQEQQQQKNNSIIEWNKLLLEQGAWAAQLRIQRMAGEELGMVVPQASDIVLMAEDTVAPSV